MPSPRFGGAWPRSRWFWPEGVVNRYVWTTVAQGNSYGLGCRCAVLLLPHAAGDRPQPGAAGHIGEGGPLPDRAGHSRLPMTNQRLPGPAATSVLTPGCGSL